MRCRLVTSSNAGICALFDRSLTAEAERHWRHDYAEWLSAAAERGDLFRYEMGGAGDCSLDCLVDEEPPEDLHPHLYRPTGELLLRVPTGQLCFAGAEYIPTEDHEAWEFAAIPGGDYAIRAWLVEPQDEADRSSDGASSLIPCLAFPLLLIVGALGVYLRSLVFAGVVVGALVVIVIGYLLWYNLSGRREEEQMEYERQLRESPPGFVVSLRRVQDAGDLNGGGITV